MEGEVFGAYGGGWGGGFSLTFKIKVRIIEITVDKEDK